ncbi:MAG: MBL fold metallo-hydrolase [Acidimicrobiales bacterium]
MKQEAEPATAELTELAPGVIRSQLPVELPGLGHVNCYILPDADGVAVVDPGLPGEESWQALVDRLGQAGESVQRVHTIIVTHSHYDHFGGAARLRDESGARVVAHASFRSFWDSSEAAEMLDIDDVDPEEPEVVPPWARSVVTPWGSRREPRPEQVDRWNALGVDKRWYRTPTRDVGLVEADVISLAGRDWVAVHTPGHTHDHLCLYDPVEGVMLSGDHVLPTITPHIGGFNSQPDPLDAFFDSLGRMHDFSDVSVVAPAHGHPFSDLAGRADEIADHHRERLNRLREAAVGHGSATVRELSKEIFRPAVWGDLADSETYTHLEHLRLHGHVTVSDRDGVLVYDATSSDPADSGPRDAG